MSLGHSELRRIDAASRRRCLSPAVAYALLKQRLKCRPDNLRTPGWGGQHSGNLGTAPIN
jgi:hypothetical protein